MRLFIFILLVICFGLPGRGQSMDHTNVILILIDDLGWNDLGCYGSKYYKTPNIDKLATQGIRFTNGYSACHVCSPTRAAILTGKYPARLMLTQWLPAGRWDRNKHRLREARYLSNLPLEEVTIAESLRAAGYKTGFIGKWHLGTETYYYPEHQGFDVNIAGRDYGAPGSYFYPFEGKWDIPSTGQTLKKSSPVAGKEGDYLVDILAQQASQFIAENKKSPFFLMLSHYAVHTPLQAKDEKVQKYMDVPDDQRQGNPKYAAMVESVDESVGLILTTLQEQSLDENTLIIFTSDNGGYAKATNQSPLRANKGSHYEGGIRVPFIIKWPGTMPSGKICDEPVISVDIYPTILTAVGLPQYPAQHQDGKDLTPLLTGKGIFHRRALYWHYPHYNRHPSSFPSGVIRSGHWKLIEHFESQKIELFNLESDLSESSNVASQHPHIAQQLLSSLKSWQRKVGADLMKTNPEFKPN